MTTHLAYDEQTLLSRIATGDEEAFASFFNTWSVRLCHFLLRHNNDPQMADDLVQEVFTKLWLTRETLPAIGNMNNYLHSIARNYAIDMLRKKIRERKRDLDWQHSLLGESDVAEREMYLDIIDRAVEQLPEQQKKTWLMSRRQQKKYIEIATALGVSRETVKTNLQLANAGITKYVLANARLTVLLILLKHF